MTVITNRQYARKFSAMEIGGVFVHNQRAYMKIEEVQSKLSGNCLNAVDMHSGHVVYFDKDCLVIPLDHAVLMCEGGEE